MQQPQKNICIGGMFAAACLLLALCLLFNAWVTEDAYITFRVVDNFIHGYGLRWNVDDRVQVYTHPLWLLIHIPVEWIFGNIFLVTIGISAVCVAAALYFLIASQALYISAMVLVLLPALFSKTFMSFAICGLEVPLGWALTGYLIYRYKRNAPIYTLCFIASLCVLTRFDNIFFLSPFLVWLVWRERKNMHWLRLFASWWPMMAWCAFSLIYYGFIFPNTKYSKLNTGLDVYWYLSHGIGYVTNFIWYDFFGFCLIVIALILALKPPRSDNDKLVSFIGAGIALHITYVLWVGGDFMAGRFFAPDIYLALWIVWLRYAPACARVCKPVYLAIIGVELAALYVPKPPNPAPESVAGGIVDEQAYYRLTNSLLTSDATGMHLQTEPRHRFALSGKEAAKVAGDNVIPGWNTGMFGYYAGPHTIIIDLFSVTDPLLARLPTYNPNARIGHFVRAVPPSYLEARRTGRLENMPPELADYYRPLRLVISGDIWSLERIKTIIRFQLGYYMPPKNLSS